MMPEDMAACHARAFAGTGRAWSAGEFTDLMNSPLVFATGDPRAFALGRVVADEAELLTLVCDPAHHRRGLGRACLSAFEAEARARGAVIAFLEVAADNAAASALYAAMGYAQVARRTGYYAGGTVDALILRKTL